MPITLGPFHITAHRGTWLTEHQDNRLVKSLTGHTKDDLVPRLPPSCQPRPAPRGPLPSLTIKWTTDATRFPTSRSLDKAENERTVAANSSNEVIRAVGQHIDQQLAQRAQRWVSRQLPLVVLVGEDHESKASLVMKLAVLEKFRDQDATVLLERSSTEVDAFKQLAQQMSARYAANPLAALQENRQNTQLLETGSRVEQHRVRETLTTLFAAKVGADVGHLDATRGAVPQPAVMDLEVRERSMAQDIHNGIHSGAGPVIATVGAMHVPRLMDALDGLFDVVAVTTVAGSRRQLKVPEFKRRASSLLARDGILCIRPSAALESQALNASQLFHQLGVDPQTPLPGPMPQRSPWER